MSRVRRAFFRAGATANQAARWAFWAKSDRCKTVGRWLERLADAEVERRERKRGVFDPPQLKT